MTIDKRIPGNMTVREAGRKGGESTSRLYGTDFYANLGRKGGNTTKQRHGPDYYREMGRKGGMTISRLVAKAKAFAEEGEKGG